MIPENPFVWELSRSGTYLLPCGGAVISEPRRAIQELQHKYSTEELRLKSLGLVRDHAELPEGVESVALGVVYYLADDEFLDGLIGEPRNSATEFLIATICGRLGRPLPEGISPLAENRMPEWFWDEGEPMTNLQAVISTLVFLALMVLILLAVYACVRVVVRW